MPVYIVVDKQDVLVIQVSVFHKPQQEYMIPSWTNWHAGIRFHQIGTPQPSDVIGGARDAIK